MIVMMIALGGAAGYLALLLSKRLILSRVGEIPNRFFLAHRTAPIFWCALSAAAYAAIYLAVQSPLAVSECSVVFTLCLSLGAVDWAIKKIPNSLLLGLIICKAAYLLIGRDFGDVKRSFWGFLVAAVIFSVPGFFRLNVGAGDIKFAAVIGLYLGISGFLQAMVIMAVLISIYGICLLAGRRGGFRTKTAMGPYLALGFICTLIYPILPNF